MPLSYSRRDCDTFSTNGQAVGCIFNIAADDNLAITSQDRSPNVKPGIRCPSPRANLTGGCLQLPPLRQDSVEIHQIHSSTETPERLFDCNVGLDNTCRWRSFSLPVDARSIGPKLFQIVECSAFGRKNVQHNIAVVSQDPVTLSSIAFDT